MSDKATLRRLLREHTMADRTEKAIIAEEAIENLLVSMQDEYDKTNAALRAQLAAVAAEIADIRDLLRDAYRANAPFNITEQRRLERSICISAEKLTRLLEEMEK